MLSSVRLQLSNSAHLCRPSGRTVGAGVGSDACSARPHGLHRANGDKLSPCADDVTQLPHAARNSQTTRPNSGNTFRTCCCVMYSIQLAVKGVCRNHRRGKAPRMPFGRYLLTYFSVSRSHKLHWPAPRAVDRPSRRRDWSGRKAKAACFRRPRLSLPVNDRRGL
jgi:hypothetical protein